MQQTLSSTTCTTPQVHRPYPSSLLNVHAARVEGVGGFESLADSSKKKKASGGGGGLLKTMGKLAGGFGFGGSKKKKGTASSPTPGKSEPTSTGSPKSAEGASTSFPQQTSDPLMSGDVSGAESGRPGGREFY